MKKCSMAAQYPLGSSHKLRLQLGWVGNQQNANLCKLRVRRVRRSFWKCLRLQKIPFFLKYLRKDYHTVFLH